MPSIATMSEWSYRVKSLWIGNDVSRATLSSSPLSYLLFLSYPTANNSINNWIAASTAKPIHTSPILLRRYHDCG
eukprot:scaffold119864_cov61-Cyclotella_meneghiniana.AAC.1